MCGKEFENQQQIQENRIDFRIEGEKWLKLPVPTLIALVLPG